MSASPPMMIVPPLMNVAVSLPTFPATRISPPCIPRHSPRGDEPRWCPALPSIISSPPSIPMPQKESTFPFTWIFPPFIQPPMYMSALPSMTISPAVICWPIRFTRVQSPRRTIFVSAAVAPPSPSTVKYFPSGLLSLPSQTSRLAISAAFFPAKLSGVIFCPSR